MRADTGVGPSIASGSQVWSGICADFAAAPPSRPSATKGIAVDERWTLNAAPTESEGAAGIRTKKDSAIVASPIAFIANAFFAAATAVGRSCQKPISRYELRPTRP